MSSEKKAPIIPKGRSISWEDWLQGRRARRESGDRVAAKQFASESPVVRPARRNVEGHWSVFQQRRPGVRGAVPRRARRLGFGARRNAVKSRCGLVPLARFGTAFNPTYDR